MHNDDHAPQAAQPGEPRHGAEAMSGEALARRRALIKGLGKGSAAIAVVAPIQTLAAPVLNSVLITKDNTLCTLSGQMSNVLSRALTNALTCTGYKPTWYWTLNGGGQPTANNWPTLAPSINKFNDIFGGSNGTSLVNVLYGNAGVPTDLSYWVAAYFNALNTSTVFPYTAQDVVNQYNGDPVQALAYLAFYKAHLSHLPV